MLLTLSLFRPKFLNVQVALLYPFTPFIYVKHHKTWVSNYIILMYYLILFFLSCLYFAGHFLGNYTVLELLKRKGFEIDNIPVHESVEG